MARRYLLIPLVAVLCFSGCKNTEDYLNDLYTVQRASDGTLPLDVYDAGQLAHEAFSGLIVRKAWTLSQVGRGLAYAGRAADRSEVALLRAHGLALLVHLALRYPLRPIDRVLTGGPGTRKTILEQTEALRKAIDKLAAGRILIPLLNSPDRADVERAFEELKKTTGQELGRDADKWRAWWNANKDTFESEVSQEALEPVRVLASIKYDSLRWAHLVLDLISTSLVVADLPALRGDVKKAVLSVGRQVVVLAIEKCLLKDESPIVLAEAALAASRIAAPGFGDPLSQAILGTEDQDAKMRLIRALTLYPGKQTMQTLLLSLTDERAVVKYNARDVLVFHSGEDYGTDFGQWRQWWEREGRQRWP